MAKGARLTGEQRKFCEEYVKTYNATQAYLAAHPTVSYDTANAAGFKQLKDQKIRDYITQLEKDIFEQNRINYEHIANELAGMAFSPQEDKRIKLKAIDLLQKQLGLQTQKVDANVSNDITITIGE